MPFELTTEVLSNLDHNFKFYHLSIELSSTGIDYVVANVKENRVEALQGYVYMPSKTSTYADDLRILLKNNTLLNINFKSAQLFIQNSYYTLIPSIVYDETLKASYFNQLTEIPTHFNYAADFIGSLDAHSVYAYNKIEFDVFKEFIPNIILHHSSALLIDIGAGLTTAANYVYVNLLETSFEVLVVKDQKIKLVNTFSYTTKEDIIYYLLLAFQQYDLDNEKTPIIISGNVKKADGIIELISKYVREVIINETPDTITSMNLFQPKHKNQYYKILNAFQCEL